MFISKLKSVSVYVLATITVAAIVYALYCKAQYNAKQMQLAKQETQLQFLQASVERWQKAAKEQEKLAKHHEKIIEKNTKESDQKIKDIKNFSFSEDCLTAIQEATKFLY